MSDNTLATNISEYKNMEVPPRDVLILVYSRLDNDTLEVLSSTSLWYEIREIVNMQYFWYLRTQYLLGSQLKQITNVDWNKTYNILTEVDLSKKLLTERAVADLLTVQVLLEIGYDPSVHNNYMFVVAARNNSLEVVENLLSDQRVNPSAID